MRMLLAFLLLSGCAARTAAPGAVAPDEVVAPAEVQLPAAPVPATLVGKVEVVARESADAAPAGVANAEKPAGQGGISDAVVVRLTVDVPVYRMWNGPEKLDAAGRTNRIGQWWTFDAPVGTREEYRRDYQVCVAWNDLAMLATCTLAAGTVVAVGPGQSVSAETCGDPTGTEAYAASATHWQVYVEKAWARPELSCPDATVDVRVDPGNLAAVSAP